MTLGGHMIHLFHRKKSEDQESSRWKEEVVTLYACRKDLENIPQEIEESFSEMFQHFCMETENHYVAQLKDGSSMNFHITTKEEETAAQTKGMANFFSQAPLDNLEVKEAVLAQILMFNCIIGIGFQINDTVERNQMLLGKINELAKRLSALLLYPSMALYDYHGQLLLSLDGQSDVQTYRPIQEK